MEITFRQKFINCIPSLKQEYFDKKGDECDIAFVSENFAVHCELEHNEVIDGLKIIVSHYLQDAVMLGNDKYFLFNEYNDKLIKKP